jgi:hypothetical protein
VAPSGAAAVTWIPYCNNATLSGNPNAGYICTGSYRTIHAEYGWGDQHAVCVWDWANPADCSSGPGVGVYNPETSGAYWIGAEPKISNSGGSPNVVHASTESP